MRDGMYYNSNNTIPPPSIIQNLNAIASIINTKICLGLYSRADD